MASRPSPRWTTSAKLLVALTVTALVAALVIRFQGVLQLLIIAGILTFLMVPIIRLFHRHARLSWRLSTHLVYFFLLLIILTVSTATGLALIQQEKSIGDKEKRYTTMIEEQRQTLEQIAGISAEEAKDRLMKLVESEMRHESAKLVKKIEEETQGQADKRAVGRGIALRLGLAEPPGADAADALALALCHLQ